jgi:very-short-patch-repair endonuclease
VSRKKLDYNYIYDYILEFGCKLISEEYKGCNEIIKIRCDKGHIYETTWSIFKSGRRCNVCYPKIDKYTFEFVKQYFEDQGCVLLSTEYKKNKLPLHYICVCGNEAYTNFYDFKNGTRCKKCGTKIIEQKNLFKYDYVFNYFKDVGCLLISRKYVGIFQKLSYICNCGNKSSISFFNFKRGQRCKECMDDRIRNTNIEKYGVPYVQQVDSIKNKMRISRNNTMSSNGTINTSRQQIYLSQLLDGKLNYPVVFYAIDIALEKEKIGIEYDGGGHDLSVKLNQISEKDFDRKELKRSLFLLKKGWREIRIISSKDLLPSDEKILEMINYSKYYFDSGHSWICFNIDNKSVKSSQFQIDYDFGELRKIKNVINKISI